MWLFVFLFSNLWGNRLGAKLADKLVSEQDSPFCKCWPVLAVRYWLCALQ